MRKIYIAEDLNHVGWLKIGQTSKEVNERIRQLNGSNPNSIIVEKYSCEAKTKDDIIFTDKQFHKYLLFRGYQSKKFEDTGRGSEYFNITLNDCIDLINEFKGFDNSQEINFRFRQKECIERIFNSFSASQEALIAAICRFGKTVSCFEIANRMFKTTNKPYIFYISTRTDTFSPVVQDYLKYKRNWNFNITLQDNRCGFSNCYSIHDTNCNLICCSKQYLQKVHTLTDINEKFGTNIQDGDVALLIYDQAHIAYNTDIMKKIKCIINPYKCLYVTGTPENLLCDQDFNFDQNNTYYYDFIAQQEDIKSGLIERKNHPYLQFFIPESPVINCDWRTFLCKQNEVNICHWIQNILSDNGDFYLNKSKQTKIPYKLNNLIAVMPREVRYCQLFYDCCNKVNNDPNSHLFNKLNVFMACDTNKDLYGYSANNQNIYAQYNKCCKEQKDKYNILITLGKGTLCISYPNVTGIILCDNGESSQQYIQSICRAKTPNEERNKLNGAIIDFNPNRVIRMLNRIVDFHSYYCREKSINPNTDIFQVFDSNLNLLVSKVYDINKAIVSTINLNRFANQYKDIINWQDLRGVNFPKQLNDLFSGNYVLTNNKVTSACKLQIQEQFFDRINKLLEASNKYIQKTYGVLPYNIPVRYNSQLDRYQHTGYFDFVTKQFVPNELIYAKFNPLQHGNVWKLARTGQHIILCDENRKEQKKKVNDKYIEKCIFLLDKVASCIPFFIFDVFKYDYYKCNSAEKFLDVLKDNVDLFCEYLGFKTSYDVLVNAIFKSIGYKKEISNSRISERDTLFDKLILKSIENLRESINEDGTFNENLWKLYDDKFNVSKNITMQIINKYNGKNSDLLICGCKNAISQNTKIYITTSKEQQFIIEKLYKHVILMYCKTAKQILDRVEKLKENNMKFDNCLTNPPYNGNVDLQILENVVPLCKRTIAVHPSTWALQNKSSDKFAPFIDKFEKNIEKIELFWANHIFKIGLFCPCSITTFDMNKSSDKITVADLDNNYNYTVNTLKDVTWYGNNYFNLNLKDFFGKFLNCDDILKHNIKNYNNLTDFSVKLALVRGDVCRGDVSNNEKEEGLKQSFFTLITLNPVKYNYCDKTFRLSASDKSNTSNGTKFPLWSFNSEEERNNFVIYLKSKIVRFLLSYYKINNNLHRGQLTIIPWLDFSKHWNDKILKEYFNISDKIYNYIQSFIPDYYDDYKQDM